jgi:hypothetical protein
MRFEPSEPGWRMGLSIGSRYFTSLLLLAKNLNFAASTDDFPVAESVE